MYAQVGEDAYWSGLVLPSRWVDMARKYQALAELARLPADEANRAQILRSAARAWPGALREAELAGPDVCRRRGLVARAGVVRPARTRAAARGDEHALAVVLWADLHLLLADLLAFRGAGGGDVPSFLASLTGRARARWPTPDRLIERGGPRPRSRQAYLWLATRAGLSLAELNRCLFARTGHWDVRADDPEWARIG